MIAIIDYGVGNLFSLKSSLQFLGLDAEVTGEAEALVQADRIILPGVGAFADAMEKLKNTGLVETLVEQAQKGKPVLGICLGMQLLFERSFEYGEHEGLGLIRGMIGSIEKDLSPNDRKALKVPHIGWNSLKIRRDDPIFSRSSDGQHMYYVHSFYAKHCGESTLGVSNYGVEIPGVVRSGSVYGMQFHPEKSGQAGLALLSAFAEIRSEEE